MSLPKENCTADDYWALPEGVRAELIDGELWDLASPSRAHQEIVMEVSARLKNHIDSHGGACKVYPAPFAVNLFADETTFVEPDVSVVCDRGKLSERGCEGAPDFVVEVVSPSNPEMDYISKLNLYRVAGVREYWICDPRRTRARVPLRQRGSDGYVRILRDGSRRDLPRLRGQLCRHHRTDVAHGPKNMSR